jgi:hypothetical protein
MNNKPRGHRTLGKYFKTCEICDTKMAEHFCYITSLRGGEYWCSVCLKLQEDADKATEPNNQSIGKN